jgi:hypothetical protein
MIFVVFQRPIGDFESECVLVECFFKIDEAIEFQRNPPKGFESSDIHKLNFNKDITWPGDRLKYAVDVKKAYVPKIGDTLLTSMGCISIQKIDHSRGEYCYYGGNNWYTERMIQHMTLYTRK